MAVARARLIEFFASVGGDADLVAVLRRGRLVELGTPAAMATNRALLAGFVSAQSEAGGWNAVVAPALLALAPKPPAGDKAN